MLIHAHAKATPANAFKQHADKALFKSKALCFKPVLYPYSRTYKRMQVIRMDACKQPLEVSRETCRVGQNHIYVVLIRSCFKDFVKYTVKYSVYTRFWPALRITDAMTACKQG